MNHQCGVLFPDGQPCRQQLRDHVHEPPPCEFGNDERHHKYVADRSAIERQWAELLETLTGLAPVLSLRQRVALRKALLP